MSEPVAKPRYFGEPRNAFDLGDIERRMRESIEAQKPAPAPEPDPLAELARLVGQANNDAFSRIFDAPGSQSAPIPRQNEAPPIAAPSRDQLYAAAFDPYPEPQHDVSYAPQGAPYGHGYAQQGYDPAQDNQSYDYGQHSAEPAVAFAQQHAAWQEQQAYPQDGYQDAYYDEPPRKSIRAKLLIGAAIVVIAGGSAAAYMLRGASGVGKDAPTIMANSGPTKVAPAGQATDGAKPSISILERGASGASQTKMVQNEEQPVDVGATARASGRPARVTDSGGPVTLAPPSPPPVSNSIFAEPKRVKAVAVRPDGTIVDGNAPAPAQRAEAPASSSPATESRAPFPAPRPIDMSSLVAAMAPSNTPGSGPKTQVRAPDAKPSKPIVVASAPATTASIPSPTGAGGAFSVQLAGTTSAAEAKDAVDRLTRKYVSELGAYRPAVLKAEVGSKTVYRVRVTGLSSEDANTLCARLKSSGGPCFVARD